MVRAARPVIGDLATLLGDASEARRELDAVVPPRARCDERAAELRRGDDFGDVVAVEEVLCEGGQLEVPALQPDAQIGQVIGVTLGLRVVAYPGTGRTRG